MQQIIIPESEVEKYTRMINKSQMIQPILTKTKFGDVYTLPLGVFGIKKIDRVAGLKDFPVQEIELKEITTDIKK